MSKEMLELAERINAERVGWRDDGGRLGVFFNGTDMDLIVAALRASAVAEPVAWQWLWKRRNKWCDLRTDNAESEIAELRRDGYEVRPLYAHPAPAAPVPASVREAIANSVVADPQIIWLRECGFQSSSRFESELRGAIHRALASLPEPEAAPTREGRHPIERLWRECGLPEYFLGNDGSNTKLYALYDAILALKAAPAK